MSEEKREMEGNNLNMEDLSLHILDIVENSINARAKNVKIEIIEDSAENLLTLIVKDNGTGMDEETKKKAINPFFTTKENKKVGLGLSLLAQAVEEAGGELKIESEQGKGTKIIATFKLNHIDRKPMGNLNETMKCLKATHPEINFFFDYKIKQ